VYTLALAQALALALTGCATSSARTVAWDDSMQSLFAGSPGDPAGQQAQDWTPEAEEQLMRQMGYADAVAVATVREVRSHDRYGNPRFVGLAFRLRAVLHGDLKGYLDDRRELLLDIDEDASAFSSTVRQLRKLPDARYLVFIKRTGDGREALRWAFYWPNPQLLDRVQALYRDLQDKT